MRIVPQNDIELSRIHFENVRGFYNASLQLSRDHYVVVGRNNAGKTSAFLLLSWIINDADPDKLKHGNLLSNLERSVLLPARSTRHRARRISLDLHIPDGRRHRKFKCDAKGNTTLRIGIRVTGEPIAFVKLGKPHRGEGTNSDLAAIELLREIQSTFYVLHIPSARDASSTQFAQRFHQMFRNKLAERALHPGVQSGATNEYRQIRQVSENLEKLANQLVTPLLTQLLDEIPPGLMEKPNLLFGGNPDEVVDWIAEKLSMRLITGKHDADGVDPIDVGAGLQSVLDIAAAMAILREAGKKVIVAIEEPEAFLHPSAQRIVARNLLRSSPGRKVLLSTHSPILVEEARYNQIVIAQDREFHIPRKLEESREDINSALLTGYGAEMVFSSSVLLVEGEGDRQFFESLRRRIATLDDSGRTDRLIAVPTGGKQQFAPWIRLIRSLNDHAHKPIAYLAVPDGDAAKDIRIAFKDASVTIPKEILNQLRTISQHLRKREYPEWVSAGSELNKLTFDKFEFPLMVLPGDLEWAIFSNCPDDACRQWAKEFGFNWSGKGHFYKKMGSKATDGKASAECKKAPWMRGVIGNSIQSTYISSDIGLIVSRWLAGAMSKKDAELLMTSFITPS